MNELFRSRRNQTVVWVAVTAALWLAHTQFPDAKAVLALCFGAAMVAVVSGALLLVLRGDALTLKAGLTSLGGVLASLYGRDK